MNFSIWHQFFLANRNHFDHIDWTDNRPLSDPEKKLITSSQKTIDGIKNKKR